jgi:hypothetical protein
MMRRLPILLPLLIGATIAVLMATLVAEAPEKADAVGRFRTVTKTFFNPTNIEIPASNTGPGPAFPYPSEIDVRAFKRGHIRDVNLTIWNYTHRNPDDVDVLLVHRDKNRTIMSDVGGEADVTNIILTLNDEATEELDNEIALSSGTFKPTNVDNFDGFFSPAPNPPNTKALLEGFDGSNPNGTWSLYVFNDNALGPGSFGGGWSLKIKARVRR